MSTNLYQEAIAEARQLKEMAEQNAKNKIIDAVTPRIRNLIERELLGEEDHALLDDELAALEPEGEDPEELAPADGEPMTIDLDTMAVEPAIFDVAPPAEVGLDFGAESLAGDSVGPSINVPAGADVNVEIGADGSVVVDTGTVDVHVGEGDSAEGEDDLLLSQEMAEALTRLLKNERKSSTKRSRVKRLESKFRKFKRVLGRVDESKLTTSQRALVRNKYIKLYREAFSLYNDAILSEGESGNDGLRRRTRLIFKEIKLMAYNQRRGLFRTLFEGDEEQKEDEKQELDELDAILTLEPEDEDEAAEVEDLLGDLAIEFEIETGEGEGDEEADAEEDLGGEDDLGGEMELEGYGESDVIVVDSSEDEVVEIDENMLRRELRRMRRLQENDPVDGSGDSSFGGGDAGEEPFVDFTEDDLLNALEDELGDAPLPDVGPQPKGGDAMPESRRRRARRIAERRRRVARVTRTRRNSNKVNESRKTRALGRQLVEYKKAVGSLRTQLTEMNLFNAKLLYANKLMQNRNVTPKQQRAVVEALDKARTLREAKLLYQSLTASLNKGPKRSLREGRVITRGSSSKSTRSAGVKSGVEVDRWAVLAGIK
jgi:hypothetical protein